MGWGCRPGPISQNPFSRFGAPRSPSPLGCKDAADPGFLTLRGNTPGSLGINDDAGFDVQRLVDPLDFDYLVRHRESRSHLVESVRLSGLHLAYKKTQNHRDVWEKQSIWSVPGAIVFRVSNLVEDVDGSMRAYHPPTEASWNGYGPHQGLGKDSLANAVSVPGVTDYARSKNEQDWPLTAGCQLFRDLNTARGLEPKAAPAQPASGQPATGKPAAPAPSQAALDARNDLDKIYKKYSVSKLSELETKSQSAVCVLYVDGRPKKDSQADWGHVVKWAGVQTDGKGKPKVRTSGPNNGFYIPAITPGWADADKHPWVVMNPPQDQFGVCKTNSAVVIKNGESPTIAYGMVADSGPWGHLGEVSRKMIDDLGFPGDSPSGDYIVVIFPQAVSDTDIAKEKQVATIRSDAQAAFEAWTWEGRSGIDLVKELFPTVDQYHRVQKDFANAKQYLNTYVDQMVLKLK
jgi:hypothetical protein